jgi:flagellar motility protein MotE (MotC chaperone)
MRFIIIITVVSLLYSNSFSQEKVTCKELNKEIKKLTQLKSKVEEEIRKNKELLKKIEKERELLRKERESLREEERRIKSERFKKLAEMFSKMDPELAGQKLSAFTDPTEAAYILYNMKTRKAGEILNYVDPKVVDKIVQILTNIRKFSLNDKP